VDKELRKAYSGHPYWLIIDNAEVGFDKKMRKLGIKTKSYLLYTKWDT
jgi:hypothetical protein